jgi:hypothetical protein
MTWRGLDTLLAVLAALFAVYAFATRQLFYGAAAGVLAGVFAIQARGGRVFRVLGRSREERGENRDAGGEVKRSSRSLRSSENRRSRRFASSTLSADFPIGPHARGICPGPPSGYRRRRFRNGSTQIVVRKRLWEDFTDLGVITPPPS